MSSNPDPLSAASAPAARPLRLLLVEDSADDAELVLRELARSGYEPQFKRADSERTLRDALAEGPWQLVLCDHGLPSFDSLEVLHLVRQTDPDVPFVILSGTIGEEAAVEALKSGVRDVVLKANLSRLSAVIERELEEVENRRLRERLERDRAELEAQLLQAQKLDAIGRLAAGIAHDYRNLLGVVRGFSELALKQLAEDEPAREHVEQIHSACKQAVELTNQLLTLSRREPGVAKPIDVNAVLAELEPMLRQLIGEDVALEVELAAGLPPAVIDPRRLEQVIMNLAANARDAMPDGGTFMLETSVVDREQGDGLLDAAGAAGASRIVLSASDSGVGIDEQTRAHIFEPFFTTKAEGHGTGLGLATSYGIVRAAGGSISVASTPGRGSTFRVCLPTAAGSEGLPAPEERQDEQPAAGTGTVLVVDDNDALRRLLREALCSSGYVVLDAASGQDALELSARHAGEINLLLTDVMMPGMRGTELAQRVLARWPRMPVLFMSAHPQEASWKIAELQTVTGFIEKPFTLASISQSLREILERDGRRQAAHSAR